MTLVFASKLGLSIKKTNVNIKKINSLAMKIYDMATTKFLIYNKLGKV